jgi:hypothetical protein
VKNSLLWCAICFVIGVVIGVLAIVRLRPVTYESDSWPTQALESNDALVPETITTTLATRRVDAKYLPNRRLTPGDIFPNVTVAMLAEHGYTDRVRSVSQAEKIAVLNRYHLEYTESATGQLIDSKTNKPFSEEVEFDHLVSLELGGSNAIENIWPEPYATSHGARTKDKLENRLHKLVVEGTVSLVDAQKEIAQDWPAAFDKYCSGLDATDEGIGEGQP